MSMRLGPEDLQAANRKGYTLGLSMAEVMLIILFTLLLFLVHVSDENDNNKLVLDNCGAFCEEPGLLQSIHDKPEMLKLIRIFKDKPETLNDWISITQGEPDTLKIIENSLNLASQQKKKIAELKEELEIAKSKVSSSKGGSTTICTFFPRDDEADGKISVSLATIKIDTDSITLLSKNIADKDVVIDFYGDPYSPNDALEAIKEWEVGETISNDEFARLNVALNSIGDAYETDYRANCRFSYDYYFDDSLPIVVLEKFTQQYYRGARVKPSTFEGIQNPIHDSGIEPDLFIGNEVLTEPAKDAVSYPVLLREVKPKYPPRAARRGLEGEVVVSYWINIFGNTYNAKIEVSDSVLFTEPVFEAVSQYKYSPMKINGKAIVSGPHTRTISFKLAN